MSLSFPEYISILNPFTGTLELVRADSAFHVKDSVNTYNDLPVSGNSENDVRIAKDTDLMYTWSISASSGLLTDWKEIGSASSIDWSAIQNKPSSSVADIDDAVSKKHTQGTDQGLDTGGANAVTAAETKTAYDHSQAAHAPSNAVSLATVKADSDVASAITNDHVQGTDQGLDTGGDNAVTALELSKLLYNVSLLGFLRAVDQSALVYNLVNGIVDQFTDETGVDTGSSTNELYDAGSDSYEPNGDLESDTDTYTDNMSDISSWTDADDVGGDSTQTTFDSREVMKLMSGTLNSQKAARTKDIGSISFSADFTFTLIMQFNNFSTQASGKYFQMGISGTSSKSLQIILASNGIWMSNGISFGQVSSTAIATDEWIEFTFHYKQSSNTVDIYKNAVLLVSDANRIAGAGTDGFISLWQRSENAGGTAAITYIDNLNIGTSLVIGSRDNMTLISDTFIAESTPTSARIVIFEEDVDSITLNTDLLAYISRDDGTTWTQATLAKEGNYATGKQILAGNVDISSQPSGTDMRYKLVTANNKDLKIHGCSLNWN